MSCNRYEREEETGMNSSMRERGSDDAFARLAPYRQAYSVIKAYTRTGRSGGETYGTFLSWLLDGRNEEAKEEAMERVIGECRCRCGKAGTVL
jgi:hypothetical protein